MHPGRRGGHISSCRFQAGRDKINRGYSPALCAFALSAFHSLVFEDGDKTPRLRGRRRGSAGRSPDSHPLKTNRTGVKTRPAET